MCLDIRMSKLHTVLMTKRLQAALEELRRLVGRGYEYPDAHSKVWTHHNLHQREADELTRMYQDPAYD